eukprot:2168044-Pleurochrysis_carterae.AAC.1
MSHGVPDSSAASASAAVKEASALCFSTYAAHSVGIGRTPAGSRLLRSCGRWATENDEHGGAANTAANSPARARAMRASP